MNRLPAWVLVMVVAISACGAKPPEPVAAPPPARKPSAAPVTLVSEVQPVVQAYDAEGRRDPFQPVKAVKRRKKKTGGQSTLRLRRTSLKDDGNTDSLGPDAVGIMEHSAWATKVVGQGRT